MAIVVRTNPVAGATASFPDDYNNQNTKYLAGQRGYVRADLDDYTDGSTAPEVVVGSEFEVDGDIVVVQTANEAISGIAAIADDNVVYVYYDVSAAVFLASITVPTWSTALGGWYNSDDRCLFGMYKDSLGDYNSRYNVLNDEVLNQDMVIKIDPPATQVAISASTWTTASTYYTLKYNHIIGAYISSTGFTLAQGTYMVSLIGSIGSFSTYVRIYDRTASIDRGLAVSTNRDLVGVFELTEASEIDLEIWAYTSGSYFLEELGTDTGLPTYNTYAPCSIHIKRVR